MVPPERDYTWKQGCLNGGFCQVPSELQTGVDHCPREPAEEAVAGAWQQQRHKWNPPDPGWVKMNVGVFSTTSGVASIRVIIRNHIGAVRLSAWQVISDASNAEEVEALACKEGITLAAEWIQTPAVLDLIVQRSTSSLATVR